MDGAQVSAAGVSVETCSGEAARLLASAVCDLYEAVFSLPPFNGDEEEFAYIRRSYPKLAQRPGFWLTTARTAKELIGFGYGYPLQADTRWWHGLTEPVSDELARETGHRTFALIDYGVLPAWRGHGVGRMIHDELLGGSGAERATLSVQPKAEQTQAIYRRWGWRKVASIKMDPPVPAPVFDILLLDVLPSLTR